MQPQVIVLVEKTMLICPYCQTQNSIQVTQCLTCKKRLYLDELPIGTRLFNDKLEIREVLGRGGFGIVYKALHLEHQRYLAVKELFQSELVFRGANQAIEIRFGMQNDWQTSIIQTQREATTLQFLKHQSATKLFACWQANNTVYTAMELLNGVTLEQKIAKHELLSQSEAKKSLVTLLEVLGELHDLGYLHRDIKPSNIMFTPDRVELIDFGSLVKFKKNERIKVTNRMLTPEYAALEQYGSEVILSPATDLYALAA